MSGEGAAAIGSLRQTFPRWQLAALLGVNERTVRRWEAGTVPDGGAAAMGLACLVELLDHPGGIERARAAVGSGGLVALVRASCIASCVCTRKNL